MAVLGPELTVSRGDLNRPSLRLQNIRLRTQAERLAWLSEIVPTIDGCGIIYTLTVRDAEMVATWLQSKGINVESYTGQTGDRRVELEEALLQNRVKALVATSALGMGFDKPDIAFVVHFQAPMSVVAYYQQVGRAGRGTSAAYGILLSGEEESDIADYFIQSAFPTRDEVRTVLAALETDANGLTVPELLTRVNLSRGRIEKTLSLLSLESPAPLVRQGSKYQLTAAPLGESFWERAERLTQLRRGELAEVRDYIALSEGHMAFLIKALDGDASEIQLAKLPELPEKPSEEAVLEAIAFLKATSLPIEPRKVWPAGGLPTYGVRGNIGVGLINETGRALARWGDAGWGGMVRGGKYRDSHFADALVEACALLVLEWNPQPPPKWVTCVPSLRHPSLVPDFAGRLAARLGLPFEAIIMKTLARPEQKTMANSSQQALNLDGTLGVVRTPVPSGPVLLIDDMVDSRWTLTVAGWLLRRHGSGPVHPLAGC